jgi:phosphoglycerate kinase
MSTLKPKKSVDDMWPMIGKRVLVRVDFNVPIKNAIISNDYRIRSALPTIYKIIDNGGICILMSHLGRPKGVKMALADDNSEKKRMLQTWMSERGTGKTAFFACLTHEEKLKVLSWCTMPGKDRFLASKERVPGKTAFFATLPEDEKTRLLDLHAAENQREVAFPQLRQYQGYEEELSLKPVADRLSELLDRPVLFAPDCLDATEFVNTLKPGDVLLLENVRFYTEESSKKETERLAMAEKLGAYCDYFVSDAFGTAHRDSATMTSIAKVLGHGAAGYLMEREINYFAQVLGTPPRPMLAIVGGAKVSDKILLLENMLKKIDFLIIGGAMAYTFLKSQGVDIAKSFCESGQSFTDSYSGEKIDIVQLAGNLLKKAKELNVEVYLPVDHVCHTECKPTPNPVITEGRDVPAGHMALDIGPKTIEIFSAVIKRSKAAVWNGPVGVFEIPSYSKGTFSIAELLATQSQDHGLLSIIGGGDSASAAELCGAASRITHVSTGGGASLELLEGKILPGIAALDDK